MAKTLIGGLKPPGETQSTEDTGPITPRRKSRRTISGLQPATKNTAADEGNSPLEDLSGPAPFTREGNPEIGMSVISPDATATAPHNTPSTLDERSSIRSIRHPHDPEATSNMLAAQLRKKSIDAQRRSTRAMIGAFVLGAAAIFGADVYYTQKSSQRATDKSQTSATASSTPHVAPPAPRADALTSPSVAPTATANPKVYTPDQLQDATRYERGIYKADTSSAKFKSYLDNLGPATGLISMIKDFTSQTSIRYEQDPARYGDVQRTGNLVFNGKESELDMRIGIAEKIVETALSQKQDNGHVRKFFQNQKRALAVFRNTKVWTEADKGNGVDKFFDAIQLHEKYLTDSDVVGYAPDISPDRNPALKKVSEGAPNFYKVLLKVGQEMQAERDPAKVIKYRDFQTVKAATCSRIAEKGKTLKTVDERSGIAFVHSAWCSPTANPYNEFNRALLQVVEIVEQTGTGTTNAPQVGKSVPVNVILNRVNLSDAPAATPQILRERKNTEDAEKSRKLRSEEAPKPKAESKPANAPVENHHASVAPSSKSSEPVIFPRTINRIKSWFGFGPKAEVKTAQAPASTVEPRQTVADTSAQPAYTAKDLPMKSWKQSIKEFFWS